MRATRMGQRFASIVVRVLLTGALYTAAALPAAIAADKDYGPEISPVTSHSPAKILRLAAMFSASEPGRAIRVEMRHSAAPRRAAPVFTGTLLLFGLVGLAAVTAAISVRMVRDSSHNLPGSDRPV